MEQYASMQLQVVIQTEEPDDVSFSTATLNPVTTQEQPSINEDVQPVTVKPEPADDDVDTELQGTHMLASP